MISKEKSYLWIGLAFIGILLTPIIFLLSSIYGIRFNFMYGPAGNTIVAIILIQFFRNILLIKNNFPKIDQLFKYINIFYFLCFLSYLYDSIDYPYGEYFIDLINSVILRLKTLCEEKPKSIILKKGLTILAKSFSFFTQ